jgi:addiction module HigA family antidote
VGNLRQLLTPYDVCVQKRKPTHPGAILRDDVFPTLNITLDEFAKDLSITDQELNDLLAEKIPISTILATKLAHLAVTAQISGLRCNPTTIHGMGIKNTGTIEVDPNH